MVKLTPQSCRAGRALLEWTTRDLAKTAGFTQASITRFENGHTKIRASTQTKLIAVFAEHGITILNGDYPGARWHIKNVGQYKS